MTDDRDLREYDEQRAASGRSGPSLFLILFLIVAAGTAVFIVQNGEPVATEFLWFDRMPKLWVAIVISIGLGILLDRLILGWWRRSRRDKN